MKFIAKVVSLSLLTVAFLKVDGFSQCQLLFNFSGDTAVGTYGQRLSPAGDVNNDGFKDFVITTFHHTASPDPGRAIVYSGQTREILYVFGSEDAEIDLFGWTVAAAGDVNNDGFDDIMIGAVKNDGTVIDVGLVYVYSGQNGEILHVFTGENYQDQFGSSLSSAGDVNNDGYDDVIIGAYIHDGAGRAYVYSGQTFSPLYVLSGDYMGDWFGFSVSTAGDINKDGYSDFAISAPRADAQAVNAGRTYIISGQDGDTLRVIYGEVTEELRGYRVVSAGDVNGDGYDEVILSPGYTNPVPGDSIVNMTLVISGLNGEQLYQFGEVYPEDTYSGVLPAGDVNNDGFNDLIIAETVIYENDTWERRLYVLSGSDQDTLYFFSGDRLKEITDLSVASLGDIDSDGYVDFLAGTIWYSVIQYGYNPDRAFVFSGRDCAGIRGDINGDGTDANILDLTYAVDRIFRGGPAAVCPIEGDINADGTSTNILDLTFMVDRIFRGGPPPGSC